MKTILVTLLLLPTFSLAAVKTVKLDLYASVNSGANEKGCYYSKEVNLGDSKSMTPFQLMGKNTDGNFFIKQSPFEILVRADGQFYFKASSVMMVDREATCPAQDEVYLVQ